MAVVVVVISAPLRYTLYPFTARTLSSEACHESLTWDGETAVATRFLGGEKDSVVGEAMPNSYASISRAFPTILLSSFSVGYMCCQTGVKSIPLVEPGVIPASIAGEPAVRL